MNQMKNHNRVALKVQKENKKKTKKTLVKPSLYVLLSVSVLSGFFLKFKRNKIEKEMSEFILQRLDDHLLEVMNEAGKDDVNWNFENVKIQFLDKTLDELVAHVTYDLSFIDAMERQYTTEEWLLKIKHFEGNRYEIVEEGETIIHEEL
jgi:hypothetical protein